MSRALSSPVATAIAQTVVPVAFFSEFNFASGPLRMWSGYGVKNWSGVDWTGAGDLGSISPVDETSDIGASGIAFGLSGVPNSMRALALADAYRGRSCKAWLAIFDAASNITGTYRFYAGRMDVMSIVGAGDTSRISLQSENCLIDLTRARSTRYTAAEQQRISPGDTSLSRIAKLAERPLPWGVPSSAAAPAAAAPTYSGLGSSFIRGAVGANY